MQGHTPIIIIYKVRRYKLYQEIQTDTTLEMSVDIMCPKYEFEK